MTTNVQQPIINKVSNFEDASKILANFDKQKISKMIMTKYEFDQIIGLRTIQLSLGAPPYIGLESDFNIKSNMELRLIALKELKEGKLPFGIKRPLPNNKYEYVRVKDLDLTAVKYMFR
jgi:DNA-directed RNA polymerase subunit K/omega